MRGHGLCAGPAAAAVVAAAVSAPAAAAAAVTGPGVGGCVGLSEPAGC